MARAEDHPTSHHQWCPVVGCAESKVSGQCLGESLRDGPGVKRQRDRELKGGQGFNVLMARLVRKVREGDVG